MEEEGKRLGVNLKLPWIVPWSRKAHELASVAEKEGCFLEIHESLFRAYLSEGRDIGRVDVLVDLARKSGLDPMEIKAALDVDAERDSVLERRKRALEAGGHEPPDSCLARAKTGWIPG